MTTVMGMKCWGDRFSYVVLTGCITEFTLVQAKHVRLPASSSRAAQLSDFRHDVFDLLTHLTIEGVCFRSQEAIAKNKSITRAEVEGVLQEACHTHTPTVPVFGRTVVQFKSILHFSGKANEVVQLFEREEFRGLAKVNFPDAAVAAMSMLSP